jgi:hypothetical protein
MALTNGADRAKLGAAMTIRLAAALVALSCTSVAGCAAAPARPSLYGPERKMGPGDYPEILRSWTRSARVYQGFDTKMFVSATLHSAELRRAFGMAFPEIYGHGGSVTRRELVELTGDVEQFHTFFVAAYTADDKWNDLAMPDSIWHLSLIGSDEVVVDPSSVEIIRVDANLTMVYPYITRFDRVYLVRFPLTDAMGRLVLDPKSTSATLRLASALGVAELRWELVPAPAQPEAPSPPPAAAPATSPSP